MLTRSRQRNGATPTEFLLGLGHTCPTFTVNDIDIAAIDLFQACALIGELAKRGQGQYVTVTGAHGIVESSRNHKVRRAYQHALLAVPDGVPLVWLGSLLGFKSIGRVYGPDLMESIFARKEYRELRHFFYGSHPAVIAKLCSNLVSRFGEFQMAGMYCPPTRDAGFTEDPDVLSLIREAKPNILWVSLSCPKQELWLHMHMHKISCGIGIGVGAAFDFLSGTKLQAPRWIQRSGFEWLFRVSVEPKRLFRRYLYVIPRFTCIFLQTLLAYYTRRRTAPG